MSQNNSPIMRILGWSAFILICIILGYALGSMDLVNILKPSSEVSVINLIISFFIGIFSVLAIHELGHLITGLAHGFQFALYVVGPFGWKKEGTGKITFYWNKDLSMFGGAAATTPKEERADLANVFGRILIAGPLTSLSFSIIFALLSYTTTSSLDFFLFISALLHFGIFLATTLPSKSGFFFTDRKRWQRLHSKGKERESELAILHAMLEESLKGHYKEAKPEILQKLKEDPDESVQLWGDYFLYKHYSELKKDDLATTHFENLRERKEQLSDSMWKMLEIDFSTK